MVRSAVETSCGWSPPFVGFAGVLACEAAAASLAARASFALLFLPILSRLLNWFAVKVRHSPFSLLPACPGSHLTSTTHFWDRETAS